MGFGSHSLRQIRTYKTTLRGRVQEFGALFAEPPGQGVVEGNEIPYQPAAAAKQKQNFEKRFSEDPEASVTCPMCASDLHVHTRL